MSLWVVHAAKSALPFLLLLPCTGFARVNGLRKIPVALSLTFCNACRLVSPIDAPGLINARRIAILWATASIRNDWLL